MKQPCNMVHKKPNIHWLFTLSLVCAISFLCVAIIVVDARSPINVMAMKWWKDNKPTKLKSR